MKDEGEGSDWLHCVIGWLSETWLKSVKVDLIWSNNRQEVLTSFRGSCSLRHDSVSLLYGIAVLTAYPNEQPITTRLLTKSYHLSERVCDRVRLMCVCVCRVNIPAIVTMQTNDDVCVQCVCTVCLRLITVWACVLGHIVETHGVTWPSCGKWVAQWRTQTEDSFITNYCFSY